MRKSLLILLAVAAMSLTPMVLAQKSETYNPLPRHFPTKQRFVVEFAGGGSGGTMAARSWQTPMSFPSIGDHCGEQTEATVKFRRLSPISLMGSIRRRNRVSA
jgi:hypothetical protein